MTRPNWFIALPAEDPAWARALVRSAPASLRTFAPEDLHLTVAFLGAVSEERARAAWELADAFSLAPLTVGLERVAPMGPARRASALAALVAEGREGLIEAIRESRDLFHDRAEIERETRAPLPHLTLARIPRGASEEERDAALAWARSLEVASLSLHLERLALYSWAEDRARRLFRIVEARKL
ncbi:MAG: hypothetical protein OEY14_10200 [Myxococcales bacterium]|nr:hypothetical protein [Myxococcales bacterium]